MVRQSDVIQGVADDGGGERTPSTGRGHEYKPAQRRTRLIYKQLVLIENSMHYGGETKCMKNLRMGWGGTRECNIGSIVGLSEPLCT